MGFWFVGIIILHLSVWLSICLCNQSIHHLVCQFVCLSVHPSLHRCTTCMHLHAHTIYLYNISPASTLYKRIQMNTCYSSLHHLKPSQLTNTIEHWSVKHHLYHPVLQVAPVLDDGSSPTASGRKVFQPPFFQELLLLVFRECTTQENLNLRSLLVPTHFSNIAYPRQITPIHLPPKKLKTCFCLADVFFSTKRSAEFQPIFSIPKNLRFPHEMRMAKSKMWVRLKENFLLGKGKICGGRLDLAKTQFRKKIQKLSTPSKFNMEPENVSLEKEKHL